MVVIIKACIFLWSYGLICGDNKRYMPDNYPINDLDDSDTRIHASEGGRLVRDIVADYLWDHKIEWRKGKFEHFKVY